MARAVYGMDNHTFKVDVDYSLYIERKINVLNDALRIV